MVILISYDLNGHERPGAYAAVEKMIKDNSMSCIKPLYSQWFADTADSVETWSTRMKKVTDDNDRWFIVRVTPGNHSGWLNSEDVRWLNSHL